MLEAEANWCKVKGKTNSLKVLGVILQMELYVLDKIWWNYIIVTRLVCGNWKLWGWHAGLGNMGNFNGKKSFEMVGWPNEKPEKKK